MILGEWLVLGLLALLVLGLLLPVKVCTCGDLDPYGYSCLPCPLHNCGEEEK